MKRRIKIIILAVLYSIYRVIKLVLSKNELVILMYHSIGDNSGPLSVSPQDFEKQILYLISQNYKFLTLKGLSTIVSKISPLIKKNILVTFDDGYRSFSLNAIPIIRKYNIPTAVFIHTNRSSENLGNNFQLMDWNEIKDLSEEGIGIGNHSHSHFNMKTLNQEQLALEMRKSEDIFIKELGYVPKEFAYPGGKYNDRIADFLNNNGYALAFTINEGVMFGKEPRFKLKRIGIGSDTTMFEFKMIITRAFNWYQLLRKTKGVKLKAKNIRQKFKKHIKKS